MSSPDMTLFRAFLSLLSLENYFVYLLLPGKKDWIQVSPVWFLGKAVQSKGLTGGGVPGGFVVQCFDPRTLFLIEPLPRKDIVSVPEYGLAVHQPPHQLLRPAGLLPSAIEMIFLLLVLAISLDQGTAPIQLCLVSVSDPGSRVLGIGKANKGLTPERIFLTIDRQEPSSPRDSKQTTFLANLKDSPGLGD
ncbi:NADH-quinone oxidoreductase subunit H [Striga asiatica]|uniref:NADH-quinone oxidoreductase subunit H n=1 Tax=Striga asiatica TaxID=4170 RepID=A0A5A7QJS0_STRAF|nr:NADH-quinone oxidoreductase subunit H [Striga asiatica]